MHRKLLHFARGGKRQTQFQLQNRWPVFDLAFLSHKSFAQKLYTISVISENHTASPTQIKWPILFFPGTVSKCFRFATKLVKHLQNWLISHYNFLKVMKIIISEIVKYVLLTIGTMTCLQDNNCEGMIIQKRKNKKRTRAKESMCSTQWNYYLLSWNNPKLAVKLQQHCQIDS